MEVYHNGHESSVLNNTIPDSYVKNLHNSNSITSISLEALNSWSLVTVTGFVPRDRFSTVIDNTTRLAYIILGGINSANNEDVNNILVYSLLSGKIFY
jgi:hypothetical protein